MNKLILLVCAALISEMLLAEGTKELRPTDADKGNLLLLQGYTMFGMYGASPKEQIKIKIASPGETIYFGFNNKNGKDALGYNSDQGVFVPDIPFRILSPSGQIVYSSVMPAAGQEGHIATWNEAVAGPQELGNPGGYDALQITASEVGDYVIEFDPAAQNVARLNIHLFDITVTDTSNNPIPGRLHSQGWQISTESYTNPFNGVVYPYDGSSAVYEVDFNGTQPWVFVINFNSTGTANTGNVIEDRKSQIGNHTYGEYEVFLNPPDEILYPTVNKDISLTGNVEKKDCMSSDFCINFTTNSEGMLEGFIDLNSNNVYEPGSGEVHFSKYIDQAGTSCIPWDGRDNQGNLVNTGSFQVVATFGFGVTHLPLYDVEHNTGGYIVEVVRPAGATRPVIFWDDSNITAGSALDGKANLTGCDPSATGGCHRWMNRGSINDNTALHLQETINTWWYSTMAYEIMIYDSPATHEVQLSFHPTDLVQGDTTVCRGDSLNFYVYNNGVHFDEVSYSYEWFFNSQSLTGDIREQKEQIMQPSEVVVKAIDRDFVTCVSYDTLHILVVDPVKLEAQVTLPPCNGATGSIFVEMTAGPPNKEFFWQEFPEEKTGTLNDLPRGTYNLIAMDPAYPGCSADTSFVLTEAGGIAIDRIDTSGTLCYRTDGAAGIFMVDPAKDYEYSWNNAAFSSASSVSSLPAGTHTVLVREVGTGCSDEREFEIPETPFPISVIAGDEVCSNGKGWIRLTVPDHDFTISWNGVSGTDTIRENLSEGEYAISVSDVNNASCRAETTASVANQFYTIDADFEYFAVSVDSSGGTRDLEFTNLSPQAVSSYWQFGDGNSSFETDPAHTFSTDQEYTITLSVQDANGCPGEVQKTITPLKVSGVPCGIAFPNAFTPNDDDTNDKIGILGYAPFVELKIFNRWGELVFRTFEIPKRWDGTFRGTESPVGVYPYILDWECPDEQGRMIRYRKVGDVSLIR